MRIEVRRIPADATDGLESYAERRLRFALGRFTPRIGAVVARLEDTNGPRGGVDKQCQVRIRLIPEGEVLVREVDADWLAAIDRAVDRVGRAVARVLKSQRDPRASRGPWPDRKG
jgi:ribosome-associated translation inhibitor RaiA